MATVTSLMASAPLRASSTRKERNSRSRTALANSGAARIFSTSRRADSGEIGVASAWGGGNSAASDLRQGHSISDFEASLARSGVVVKSSYKSTGLTRFKRSEACLGQAFPQI